jgi:2-oxoglutarate dehydrogenase E1 component
MSTSEAQSAGQTSGEGSAQPVREPGPGGPVPIEGIDARLVANMTASLGIPTATSFRDIPVDVLIARREQLNAAIAPARLSLTHLIAYALAQAAGIHPTLAAHFVEIDGRPHRVDPAAIDLGLAVDVTGRDGHPFLVVPVVRAADELDFADFMSRYDDLVGRARANRLSADDMVGAGITLTNPGTVGTTASVPRLMPGQGAIIATGAIRRLAGGAVMTVSSTYDHRVIQGAESGRFLRTLEEFLAGSDEFYEWIAEGLGVPRSVVASPVPTGRSAAGSSASLAEIAGGVDLVRSFRHFGYRAADLDPLGGQPPGDEALDPATWGLTAAGEHPGGDPARAAPHLLRHDRFRGRAHQQPRGADLAAADHRNRRASRPPQHSREGAASRAPDSRGDLRTLPRSRLPWPEALLHRGPRHPGSDAGPDH